MINIMDVLMVLLLLDHDTQDVLCFTRAAPRGEVMAQARRLQDTSAGDRARMTGFLAHGGPDPVVWNQLSDWSTPLVFKEGVQVGAVAWARQ